jgi:tRNA U38,U39,U40 pseudouridine synthase TruA
MVRELAGFLLDVGAGRRTPEELATRLRGPARGPGGATTPLGFAGPTAPARGLVLARVDYPEGLSPLW